MGQGFSLDTSLLQLSPRDYLTLRDAFQNVLILGAPGSGKTSGSGSALAHAFLLSGAGGLVLCAKPEEVQLWYRYCAETGRTSSIIHFDGKRPGFNFIAYELERQGADGLNGVVECLMRILEMARAASPTPGRGSEAFWEDTTRQILRNSIPVLYAATGTVRIEDLLRFVREAPTSPEKMRDPEWQRSSFFYRVFASGAPALGEAEGERIVSYWQRDFAMLDPKTRGNINISLTTTLDRFNHGWLREAFCSETTVVPELSFHGAIILLAMPALTLFEDGIIAQQLFKYMWQRAVLSRNGFSADQQARPVFLWADEAQYFVNSQDAEFLSTCRGSRCATVYLSQNLPTFYAKVGGENPRDRVQQLLGNFATKVWHNNSCAETNEWAARTVGRSLQQRANYSENEGSNSGTNYSFGANMGDGNNRSSNRGSGSSFSYNSGQGGSGGSWSAGVSCNSGSSEGTSDNRGRSRSQGGSEGTSSGMSRGYSEQMDYLIEPAEFGRMLRTGGPANNFITSAVWFQAGRRFEASRGNSLLTEFVQ